MKDESLCLSGPVEADAVEKWMKVEEESDVRDALVFEISSEIDKILQKILRAKSPRTHTSRKRSDSPRRWSLYLTYTLCLSRYRWHHFYAIYQTLAPISVEPNMCFSKLLGRKAHQESVKCLLLRCFWFWLEFRAPFPAVGVTHEQPVIIKNWSWCESLDSTEPE